MMGASIVSPDKVLGDLRMYVAHHRLLLAGTLLLPLASQGITKRPDKPPQTQCDPAQLGRESKGKAVAGVPLPGGLTTGMTQDEVRLAAPLFFKKGQRVEIIPGLSLIGGPKFEKRSGPLNGVSFYGPSVRAPAAILTQRFGTAMNIDYFVDYSPSLGGMPSFHGREATLDKWCDGQRVYLLYVGSEHFFLTVTAPTHGR